MMEEKEKRQLQAQVAALARQLADTQDALNRARTANRRLVQDNHSLRYMLRGGPGTAVPRRDPRVTEPTTE